MPPGSKRSAWPWGNSMKISIVCSDPNHPIRPRIAEWAHQRQASHEVRLVEKVSELSGGDVLFLISCHEIVRASTRSAFTAALVVHASDLPRGRGWSPHIWQILEGRSELTVTLLEAEDNVDSGAIWAQRTIRFDGHELYDEINAALFDAEISLMNDAVDLWDGIQPRVQDGGKASYYPRRHAEDSRLDPSRPIAEQFNLLRVADPSRYPAFFELQGYQYEIQIRKRKKVDQ